MFRMRSVIENLTNKKFFVFLIISVIIIEVIIYAFSDNVSQKYLISNHKNISKNEERILPKNNLSEYVEIIDSCSPYFEGVCVNARSGPSVNASVLMKLRNGLVLKVGEKIDLNGEIWYKIVFDEWLRYDDRMSKEFYVFGKYVKPFLNEGVKELAKDTNYSNNKSAKKIIIDRGDQKLYAYENGALVKTENISTGIDISPTPRGVFHVYKKTPSRYMQGPIEGINEKYYDLPGVPWNLYFTEEGAVIHGAYWHDNFGKQWSSGCVNLPSEKAKELYGWADLGTEVVVQD